MEGWLIYRRRDAERNSHYIDFYKRAGQRHGVSVLLRYLEDFSWAEGALFYGGEGIEKRPDFVIMRADVPQFSGQLEGLGYRVFNNAYLSRIANDKEKTLRLAAEHGIPVPKTRFVTHADAMEKARALGFPLVIKPPDGHGGMDVYMLKTEAELTALLAGYAHRRFLLQRPVSELGKDLRVYVLGGRIVACMLRVRQDDFRSNYCLGGEARPYTLSPEERQLVERVISLFRVDYAGFDFMFDEGRMVLNEIEDVVGARMLYHLTKLDIVDAYIAYIKDCLTH